MEEKVNHKIRESFQQYQRLGWPVIPCMGKKPLIKDWTKRTLPPTDEEIDQWIKRWPDLNIGLVLGVASGIVGIDVDGDQALARLKQISRGRIRRTLKFKTPGSQAGCRFLFRLPEGTQRATKWVEQIDNQHVELAFLGDGQQTILPPSIHPSGKKYAWIKGKSPRDLHLAEAPQWMLDRMTGRPLSTRSIGEAASAQQSEDVAAVFDRLKCCRRFAEVLAVQTDGGLSEDDWFLWISLLVNAGHAEAAREFSRLSSKHDARSEERLRTLIEQAGATGGPMTRCSTFGCVKADVAKCFAVVHEDVTGAITNSPGAFIKNIERPLPPTDPAYAPYLRALQDNKDFVIDEQGHLLKIDKSGNPYRIANFVARPICEVIRDDGVTQTRTFRIEGLKSCGQKLLPVDVAAAEFKRMAWVTEHWGIGIAMRAGFGSMDLCREAIQEMALDVEQHHIFTHMGWQLADGRWAYLHSGGAVGAEHVDVDIEHALRQYCLATVVKRPKRAARASINLLKVAPQEITLPILALAYLAPLCEPLRQAGIEPNFVMWLFGGTGTRKTSLAMLFLSHFGDFGTKSPPASFKDTANALERKAFATKDALLLIDDFHPETSSGEAQKMAQTAQRVLRMFGDRIGRGRLTANIQFQKDYPPRGMALVTGEDLPRGESSVARFLGIELAQGAINLEMLTAAQQKTGLLAEAMTGYIHWLLPQMDVLPAKLHQKFLDRRSKFQQQAAHGRSGEAAAWLAIGWQLALRYWQHIGVCSHERAEQLQADANAVFLGLIRAQNSLIVQERPADIFIAALKELCLTSKVRITPISAGTVESVYEAICGDRIGWYDDSFFYLIPDVTYNAVNRFLAGRNQRLPVSPRMLWKNLDEAKMIYTETSEGRVQRCPKHTVPTKKSSTKQPYRPRLLHLYKTALENDGIGA